MKKIILLMVSVFAFVFGSCTSAKVEKSSANENTAKITLEGNSTTGFSWEYSQNPDGIVEISETETYLGKGDIVGAPSRFDYVLSPVKDGETTLTFIYRRSWETEPPAETKSYKVTVKAGKVSVEKK